MTRPEPEAIRRAYELCCHLAIKQQMAGLFRADSRLLKELFGRHYRRLIDELIRRGSIKKVANYSTLHMRAITYALGANPHNTRGRASLPSFKAFDPSKDRLSLRAMMIRKAAKQGAKHAETLTGKYWMTRLKADLESCDLAPDMKGKKGRLYTVLTNLRKDKRPKGFQIVDIHSTYPFLLSRWLTSTPNHRAEREKLLRMIKTGRFYEELGIGKRQFFSLVMFSDTPGAPEARKFAKEFQNLARMLRGRDRSKLSDWLNGMEGLIMRTALSAMQEATSTPVLTIHDSLLVKGKDLAERARIAITDAAKNLLGASPVLKTTTT